MPFRYRPECLGPLESVLGQPAVIFRQVFDGQPQIVWVFHERQEFLGLFQADLPLCRRPLATLDPLVHCVHAGPREVCLRVWQLRLVVRASRLAQSKESLAL